MNVEPTIFLSAVGVAIDSGVSNAPPTPEEGNQVTGTQLLGWYQRMIPFEIRSFAVSRWVALTESLRSKVPSAVLSGAYTKKRWRWEEPSASVDILREVICGTIP